MSGVDIPEDHNIHEAWDKACRAFARMTQADLTESPKRSVDEVLEEIRRKQDGDEEKHKKCRAAKDVISKTGNFIVVLGGIAAQGVSMVFAPSSLGFNAISYLIETGAKYNRIFSSRISDVLERCKIYMRLPAEAVDASLRKIINEELICFVEICALSIKVMRGNKMLIALKVFAFDSDEGVSAQLERLPSLVEREAQMRATLGFESQKINERVIVEARDGTRRVSASAQAQIGLGRLGYEESRKVARTLREYETYEEAIKQFKYTSTLAEGNWLSQHGLAVCCASQSNLDTAIDILEATIKRIKDEEFGAPGEADGYLPDMYNGLATWYRSIGRDEVALAIYQKSLNNDSSNYDTASNLIIMLHEQARFRDLVGLLQSLKDAIDPDSGLDLRTKTVQKNSLNESLNEALFALAQDDAEFGLVLESYEEALAAARARLLEARKAGNIREERFAQGDQIPIMMQIGTLYQRASHGSPARSLSILTRWIAYIEDQIVRVRDFCLVYLLSGSRDIAGLGGILFKGLQRKLKSLRAPCPGLDEEPFPPDMRLEEAEKPRSREASISRGFG
ncbi:hypothetical protein BJX65DRAFT_313949 [Aspergillus insuetus]